MRDRSSSSLEESRNEALDRGSEIGPAKVSGLVPAIRCFESSRRHPAYLNSSSPTNVATHG